MSRGVFRVVCKPTKQEWAEYGVVIDVILDDDGKMVSDRPFFGFQGKAAEPSPFVLLRDGRLDFGADYGQEDRYYFSNIRNKEIKLGNYFTITMHNYDTNREEEVTYSVGAVLRL